MGKSQKEPGKREGGIREDFYGIWKVNMSKLTKGEEVLVGSLQRRGA